MPSPRSIRAQQRFLDSRARSVARCTAAVRSVRVRHYEGHGSLIVVVAGRAIEQQGAVRAVDPRLRGPGLSAVRYVHSQTGRN
ncbi:MAG: hypothetical protein AAF809_03910 [Bacteroidota bacterium]